MSWSNLIYDGQQELNKAQRDLARVKKELTELATTLERLNAELKVPTVSPLNHNVNPFPNVTKSTWFSPENLSSLF